MTSGGLKGGEIVPTTLIASTLTITESVGHCVSVTGQDNTVYLPGM